MTSDDTNQRGDRRIGVDADEGESVAFPESAVLRDLMRLRRKRAAERPALEAFKRERLEAHRRLVDRCEQGTKAG